MSGVSLLVDVDSLTALLVLVLLAEEGNPETSGNATEAEEQEKSYTSNNTDDDTSDGTSTQTSTPSTSGTGCSLIAGLSGRGFCVSRSRGAFIGFGRCTAVDDSGGTSDSVGCRVLSGELSVASDNNGGGFVVTRLCRALTLVGASLPASAADLTALFLFVVFGNTVNALCRLWRRLPAGHDCAGVCSGLCPGGGVVADPASLSTDTFCDSVGDFACLVRTTAVLVIGAAV